LAGSWVVVSLLAAGALELGWALELEELELESAGALAPPEAEPDFAESADEELGGVTLMDVLDEDGEGWLAEPEGVAALLLDDESGVVELLPVPPTEAELDEEPGVVGAGVALSLRALELEEPGADEVRSGPLLQAARPKASATASARVESFMSPPWLG
jgi:hypothetical protein